MTTAPSWGVLARAPAANVAVVMSALANELDANKLELLTHGAWTAAFYMEPTPTSDVSAAELRHRAGIDAAHLNFDVDGYQVCCRDGREWNFTGEDPVSVCAIAGIQAPGHDLPSLPVRPFRPTRVRAASVVDRMSAATVEAALCPSDMPDHVEDGPRGDRSEASLPCSRADVPRSFGARSGSGVSRRAGSGGRQIRLPTGACRRRSGDLRDRRHMGPQGRAARRSGRGRDDGRRDPPGTGSRAPADMGTAPMRTWFERRQAFVESQVGKAQPKPEHGANPVTVDNVTLPPKGT